jgi:hypothetical protein
MGSKYSSAEYNEPTIFRMDSRCPTAEQHPLGKKRSVNICNQKTVWHATRAVKLCEVTASLNKTGNISKCPESAMHNNGKKNRSSLRHNMGVMFCVMRTLSAFKHNSN